MQRTYCPYCVGVVNFGTVPGSIMTDCPVSIDSFDFCFKTPKVKEKKKKKQVTEMKVKEKRNDSGLSIICYKISQAKLQS